MVRRSQKTKICQMTFLSLMSFANWLLKLHSHISILWTFCGISVITKFSFFGIGLKTKTRKSRKMNVDLVFDHYFSFSSFQTDINKKGLNLKNPEGSKVFKSQIPATWLTMWLNDFECDHIWSAIQLLLKLHSHISVLLRFCRISKITEF